MIRRPPRSTRTDTLFPDTTRFRSRAYREPGVQQPDPLPAGSPAGVPRWNTNPEVVAVSSRALGSDTADVMSGCLVTGATGPLDYTFRRYTIYPETSVQVDCSGVALPAPALEPGDDDVTIASFNMERFFRTEEPTSELQSLLRISYAVFCLKKKKNQPT